MSEEELKQMDKEQLLGIVKAQQFEIERLNKLLEEQRHFYLGELEKKDNIIKEVREYIERHQYKWYDLNGEEYIEPTQFDKNTNPKVMLEILDKEK